MNLLAIEEGTIVVAKDDYYKGLVGEVVEVRRDKTTFESENETEYEIVVDLIETANMDASHPDLNGTSVSLLIMGEDELFYFFDGIDGIGTDIEDKLCTLKDVIVDFPNYNETIQASFGVLK